MKKNENGFMLLETLVVTVFVAGVLIFLYIQFSNLSKRYNDSYKYNTAEDLYALEDIKDYILYENISDTVVSNVNSQKYLDISNCSIFKTQDVCISLLDNLDVDKIFITTNLIQGDSITEYDNDFLEFIGKIKSEGGESYRLVASFKKGTYATIRFSL